MATLTPRGGPVHAETEAALRNVLRILKFNSLLIVLLRNSLHGCPPRGAGLDFRSLSNVSYRISCNAYCKRAKILWKLLFIHLCHYFILDSHSLNYNLGGEQRAKMVMRSTHNYMRGFRTLRRFTIVSRKFKLLGNV